MYFRISELTNDNTQIIVFGRDMLFNIKKVINWQLITKNKCKQIARDNIRENTECIPHQYIKGEEILCVKRGVQRKYFRNKSNPYRITSVHTNGTVTIAQGAKHQTISIRNIEPYFRDKYLE